MHAIIHIPLSDHQLIFVSRELNSQSKKHKIDNKFIEIRFWKDFSCDKLLETVNKIDFSQLYSSQEFNPNDFFEKLTENYVML